MPGFDGTGPVGQGPLTGRQLGYCPGARSGLGLARRFGRGYGRGFARGFGYNQANAAARESSQEQISGDEHNLLHQRISQLEAELEALKNR